MTKEITTTEVKKKLRDEIVERYGSVGKFLNHSDFKNLRLQKQLCRTCLYESGPVSYEVYSKLWAFFQFKGSLSKKTIIKREVKYFVEE